MRKRGKMSGEREIEREGGREGTYEEVKFAGLAKRGRAVDPPDV